MAKAEQQPRIATQILSDDQFQDWLYSGLSVKKRSKENIFQPGAPLEGAYTRFVRRGGIYRMEEQELSKLQSERLERVYPVGKYVRLRDSGGNHFERDKSLVLQRGRSNNYMPLEEYLETPELKKFTARAFVHESSGSGYSFTDCSLSAWLKNGDPEHIMATDFISKTKGARTGDILGGPNSMNCPTYYSYRTIMVNNGLIPDGYHLSIIDNRVMARVFREVAGGIGR